MSVNDLPTLRARIAALQPLIPLRIVLKYDRTGMAIVELVDSSGFVVARQGACSYLDRQEALVR